MAAADAGVADGGSGATPSGLGLHPRQTADPVGPTQARSGHRASKSGSSLTGPEKIWQGKLAVPKLMVSGCCGSAIISRPPLFTKYVELGMCLLVLR